MRPILVGGLLAVGIAASSGDALGQAAPAGGFGNQGQLALQADLQLHFEGYSYSDNGGSGTDFLIQPAADYFVIDHLSVGGAVPLHVASPDGGRTTITFGIEPRVGYDIPIVEKLSFWPDLFFSFETSSRNNNGGSDTAFGIGVFAPLLFHPIAHFFLGIGPNLSTEFSHTYSAPNGRSGEGPKLTQYGIMSTIGGWLAL